MEKGLNAVHPARRAPMGAHLVIQAVGRRSMAEEEARRGMDARAQFPRQPAEDDVLRPDGGNPAAVRHNTLHKRPAHQVARSAAGEPPVRQGHVAHKVIAAVAEAFQAVKRQPGIVVALEKPVKVIMFQGILIKGKPLGGQVPVIVLHPKGHYIGLIGQRSAPPQEKSAFHTLLRMGKPGLPARLAAVRRACAAADAHQDIHFFTRPGGRLPGVARQMPVQQLACHAAAAHIFPGVRLPPGHLSPEVDAPGIGQFRPGKAYAAVVAVAPSRPGDRIHVGRRSGPVKQAAVAQRARHPGGAAKSPWNLAPAIGDIRHTA